MLPVFALGLVAAAAGVVLLTRDQGGRTSQTGAVGDSTAPANAGGAPRLAPESNVCQGILHRPAPGSPQTFPGEYTQRSEAAGLAIVANANVDPKAIDEAVRTVERLFRDNDLEGPLAAEGAYVIVADASQGVLDLPEFKCMDSSANQNFFSHVCGIADRADYPVVTVNELDLLGNRRGPCAGLNILYHELGHLVQGWSMGPTDYFDIHQYFQDAVGNGKYKGAYAATNANEYFAEATQAYFLTADPEGKHDRAWLKTYDQQIYELAARVYGE
jgi:hypothetical protein